MANIKISELTAAAAATGTQEFEVNDSLTSKKVTGAQVLSYVHANTAVANVNGLQTALDGKLSTANGAVGSSNLANNAVITDKINNGAVTVSKIGATGTPGSGNFLRGDGAWGSVDTSPKIQILDTQIFTTSGTWTKPAGFSNDDSVVVILIGAGGSGGACRRNNTANYAQAQGGAGGAVCIISIPYSQVASSVSVTIGAGGSVRTASNETPLSGNQGGHTVFGDLARAIGGHGGYAASDINFAPTNGGNAVSQPFYGNSGDFVGVGSGRTPNGLNQTGADGRVPQFGTDTNPIPWGLTGGGGAAHVDGTTSRTQTNAAGTGRLFGSGGEGRGQADAFAGTAPGGGGGGSARINASATSGAGARGEAQIYVVKGRVSGSTILGVTL